MREKRQSNRWQINQQAKLKLAGAQRFAPCVVRDINLKGVQISLRMKLPEDNFLKLTLVLSDEITLDIEVWAAWHKNREGFNVYGLYFSQIKEEDKMKIYKFIYNCFPEEMVKKWGQELAMQKGDETMQDRRIFARFPARFPLRYLDLEANGEGQAQTTDISAKGIGFITDKELSRGAPLELWLNIPDRHEPLYMRGEVAWSQMLEPNKYRAGIELEKAELMGMSRVFRA